MKHFIALLASLIVLPLGFASPAPLASDAPSVPLKQRVILISVDGARADFVRDLDLPIIHGIAKNGSYTYQAQTILPSQTLPGHASMLSGYTPEKHGIRTNEWQSGLRLQKDTIFDRIADAGKTSKLMAAKQKFETFRKPGPGIDLEIIGDRTHAMVDEALETLSEEDYDFLFVHFKAPDRAGHDFGADSVQYTQAIKGVDASIGTIINRLRDKGVLASTTIIITADHGMRGNNHGGKTPEEMSIPWIAMGPRIKSENHIRTSVSVMDTAATVLWLFDLPIPSDMDGKVPAGIEK